MYLLYDTGQKLVVDILYDNLSDTYKKTRYKPIGAEWPPNQPKVIVSVALIHYKGKRTKQELIQIASRHKEGATAIDELISNCQSKRPRIDHSRITKDITDIFAPDPNTNELPTRILIEGAPGIGKTVLAKEVAYCWANHEILHSVKILFLLILRDPTLQKVENFSQLIHYVSMGNLTNQQIDTFISQVNNVKLGFVFDGFDEYPSSLQEKSYIVSIINGEVFPNSIVVITSRPTTTISLHDRVDRRIDILGFAKEEREEYILQSLDEKKREELDKFLKQKPTINALCFIPLHLAVLLYLFQQGSLPETLTEMNESFIVHTIYRHLKRHGLAASGMVVKSLDEIPKLVLDVVHRLSKLAYKGLQEKQLVFTFDELEEACPNISEMSGAINGFGLLQAVQHYPQRGAGDTTSFNFLHYTMQEYLAARHVTTLSSDEQSSLMKNTFWDGNFNFMWIMYVGIVGIKSEILVEFISRGKTYDRRSGRSGVRVSENILNDKRKRLHVFQCFVEAKSNAPEVIKRMFKNGKVKLKGVKLLPHHISSLTLFMSNSYMHWKILQLSGCHMGDIGMSVLEQFITENIKTMPTLEYFDLRENSSSLWGVYCSIIRHCNSNSLTLCGDDGIEDSINEVTQSLQFQANLHSLTLSYIGDTGLKSVGIALASNSTLHELHVSWSKITEQGLTSFLKLTKNNTTLRTFHLTKNRVTRSEFINLKHSIKNLMHTFTIHASWNEITNQEWRTKLKSVVTILSNSAGDIIREDLWTYKETFSDAGIIIFSDCLKEDSSTQELDLENQGINSDRVKILAESLAVNTTVKKLVISRNKLYNNGAATISTYLKNNSSIQELDISYNHITSEGATKIAKFILVNKTIHTLNLKQGIRVDDRLLFNMIILTAVHYNNTLIKLILPLVHSDDEKVTIRNELEKINTSRERKGISALVHTTY